MMTQTGEAHRLPVLKERHLLGECRQSVMEAQRKIPVVLHFLHHRHKAGGASPLA